MAYPKQKEIQIPLLIELKKQGGKAKPQDLYDKVAQHFPELTQEDLERRMENHPSINKWKNMVQWVRQSLVESQEIDSSIRGVWGLTEKGLKRLADFEIKKGRKKTYNELPEITLEDMLNSQESNVRKRLLESLKELKPVAFENFAKLFLEAFGFSEVVVTKKSKDGGIDGHGKLRQGIVKINAAFQCKKWQGNVPRPEIDKFRGAISGKYDQGIFLTTSSFSKETSEVSIRPGAVPIILIDGEHIVELMLQQGIGVSKRPLYIVTPDETFFEFNEQ